MSRAALHFLTLHLGWLAHRPEAEDAFDELEDACARVSMAVDTTTARMFLGPCDVCGREMYAPAGAKVVECRPCGLVHDLPTRRAEMVEKAGDYLENAADIAAYLTTYGEPIDAAKIRQWAKRGRLIVRANDGLGRALYRVGDVLDLLRDATRLEVG